MTDDQIRDARAAFEMYALRNTVGWNFTRDQRGDYPDQVVDCAWEYYLAATERMLGVVAERDRQLVDRCTDILALQDRLEMRADDGTLLPQSCDGIACRDETIRLQDKRIADLERQLAAARVDRERWIELLQKLLDTRQCEAKAILAAQNANANFYRSDDYLTRATEAMIASSSAEIEAHSAIQSAKDKP